MSIADEVFGWAMKASDHTQRLQRKREIRTAISEAESRCGSCAKWLIPACPREVHSNVTGRRSGPHCNAFKCGEFVMSDLSASRLVMLRLELETLKDHP